jgi:hypothetical protein
MFWRTQLRKQVQPISYGNWTLRTVQMILQIHCHVVRRSAYFVSQRNTITRCNQTTGCDPFGKDLIRRQGQDITNTPRPLPLKYFPVHHSCIILIYSLDTEFVIKWLTERNVTYAQKINNIQHRKIKTLHGIWISGTATLPKKYT